MVAELPCQTWLEESWLRLACHSLRLVICFAMDSSAHNEKDFIQMIVRWVFAVSPFGAPSDLLCHGPQRLRLKGAYPNDRSKSPCSVTTSIGKLMSRECASYNKRLIKYWLYEPQRSSVLCFLGKLHNFQFARRFVWKYIYLGKFNFTNAYSMQLPWHPRVFDSLWKIT